MTEKRVNPSFSGLKALVIGMGVLIVVGVIGLAVAIFQRAQVLNEVGVEPASAPLSKSFGVRRLGLPTGAEVIETVADGDRLLLRVRSQDGSQRIVSIDLVTGETLGTFLLGPE